VQLVTDRIYCRSLHSNYYVLFALGSITAVAAFLLVLLFDPILRSLGIVTQRFTPYHILFSLAETVVQTCHTPTGRRATRSVRLLTVFISLIYYR
jgi:hypothetical protein